MKSHNFYFRLIKIWDLRQVKSSHNMSTPLTTYSRSSYSSRCFGKLLIEEYNDEIIFFLIYGLSQLQAIHHLLWIAGDRVLLLPVLIICKSTRYLTKFLSNIIGKLILFSCYILSQCLYV